MGSNPTPSAEDACRYEQTLSLSFASGESPGAAYHPHDSPREALRIRLLLPTVLIKVQRLVVRWRAECRQASDTAIRPLTGLGALGQRRGVHTAGVRQPDAGHASKSNPLES